MRAIIIIYLVVFLSLNTALAQKPPGYLGKRNLIGVCYDYSPGYGDYFNLMAFKPDYSFSNFMLPTPRVGIMLKRVIKNNKTLNLAVTYQGGTIGENVTIDDSDFARGRNLNYFKSSVTTLTIGISDHQSNVAPMGTYLTKGLIFARINSNYKIETDPEVTKLLIDLGIHGGYGVRRIFYDKLALDFGVETNIYVIGLLETLGGLSEIDSEFENNNPERAANAMNNLVVVRLGVSYLL